MQILEVELQWLINVFDVIVVFGSHHHIRIDDRNETIAFDNVVLSRIWFNIIMKVDRVIKERLIYRVQQLKCVGMML